ncbi:MAG: succinate dehydrogenase, partial [Deinococcus sp.]|nr:succinate dehydrogenase [Deinococcus sp.]
MTQAQITPSTPATAAAMMTLKVKVLRFDPEKDKKAHWVTYEVEAQAGDRVLDVINHVKWYMDPSLTFRRSCAHG